MAYNATHIKEMDLIEKQGAAEAELLSEFRAGAFTIDNPLVKLNPYYVSPCSALVLFSTDRAVAVTVTVRGKETAGDISHTYPAATEHILPILGLYADYDNTVDIRIYQGVTKTLSIKTEPLAASVPELISMETTAAHLLDNLIVVSPAVSGALTGFDYRGDVRWYISIPMQMDFKRLKNGHFIAGTHRLIANPYYTTGLYEFDGLGKVYKEYLVPGGYHHDQLEMESGDILALSEDFNTDTVEDMCVLLDRDTGEVKKIWDFKKFMNPGEGKSGKYTEEDWFHNNAVWYDENTNSLTLSARHIDAMVNIDYDSGELNWILGDPETWPEDKQKYFFKPVGDKPFDWQYAQHACLITPDGDVMCFDNGTLRSKVEERFVLNRDNYSRAVRYRINTADMTIEQVWEYGRELGSDFFSQHISNVEYYKDGHYLIHSGGKQLYDDIPFENLLPHGNDPRARREGLTIEVIDDKKVLEMRIKGNYYRAEKTTLYHDGAIWESGPGKKVGNLAESRQAKADAVPAASEAPLPEECMLHVIEEADRVTVKARFEKDQAVTLVFEGSETRCYSVDTNNRYAMFAGGGYIPNDPRNTSTAVNKNGLSGEYAIAVVIDGKRYETGVRVRN